MPDDVDVPAPELAPVGPWVVRLYREDSTGPLVYPDVQDCYWAAGNTVLVIAQGLVGAEPVRWVHWPRERFVHHEVTRGGGEPSQEGEALHEPAAAEGESERLTIGCDCGATTVDGCSAALEHGRGGVALAALDDSALGTLVAQGCEAARTILHTRHNPIRWLTPRAV